MQYVLLVLVLASAIGWWRTGDALFGLQLFLWVWLRGRLIELEEQDDREAAADPGPDGHDPQ